MQDFDQLTSAMSFVTSAMSINAMRFPLEGALLENGKVSPYTFNTASFRNGKGLKIIGEAYAEAIQNSGIEYDVVFGPSLNGVPLPVVASIYLFQKGLPDEYCYYKKQEEHKGALKLTGAVDFKGKRVIILKDVILDGAHEKAMKDFVESQGGTVVAFMFAFDMMEKSKSDLTTSGEIEKEFGIPISSAANLNDLIAFLEKNEERYYDELRRIYVYRQHGAPG